MNRLGIIVLGMHRSGTSATARILNLLGCDLPRTLMPARDGNDAGHWESEAVCELNDNILGALGSGWDDWLPVSMVWPDLPRYQDDVADGVAMLRQEFGQSALFVLKDPRICRMAQYWIKVIKAYGSEPRFVIPLRNPMEVAASLVKRNDMFSQYAVLLWLRHVLDAEQGSRGFPRVFINYRDLLHDWRAVVSKIERGLGLELPRKVDEIVDEMGQFVSADLRHHAEEDGLVLDNMALSGWIRRAYLVLLRWTEQGEDQGDYGELDALLQIVDEAAPAFAGLLRASHDALARAKAVSNGQEGVVLTGETLEMAERDGDALRQLIAAQEAGLQSLHAQFMATEARAGELRAQLEQESLRAEHLAQERSRLEQQVAEVGGQLEAARVEITRASDAHQAQLEQLAAESQEQSVRHAELEAEFSASVQALTQNYAQAKQQMFAELSAVQQQLAQAQELTAIAKGQEAAALEQITQLRHRLGELESHLAQRSEEVEQAWAALAQEREERLGVEQALAQEVALRKAADEKLVESNGWVFRLAGERRSAEQDLARQAARVDQAEARLVRAEREVEVMREVAGKAEPVARESVTDVADLVRRAELAEQFEAALQERDATLERLVAQHAQELAERDRVVAQRDRVVAQRDRVVAEVTASRAVALERVTARDARIVALDADLEAQRAKVLEAGAARMEVEVRLSERYSEVATLTSLLRQQNSVTKASVEKAEWLRQVQKVLGQKVKWSWAIGPARLRQIQLRRLRSRDLFDADAYLARYSDVAEAGADPLQHYISHGIDEGRSPCV